MLHAAGSAALLEIDPDLGTSLDCAEFEEALATVRVALLELDGGVIRGKWGEGSPQLAGLLVTDGALIREVRTTRRVSAELIGPGDLIRPFEEDGEEDLPVRTDVIWRVVQPTTLATVDGRLLQAVSHWPNLAAALVARAVRRAQRLGTHLAISHMVRIADRLLLLFWHLATQWGRVTGDGVVIDVPLTHSQLALMVGSERPSVTTALGQLAHEGLVERLDSRGWRLIGPMPDDVDTLLAHTSALARHVEA